MHEQAHACWEDDFAGMRFETDLIGPEDAPAGAVYLELLVTSTNHRGYFAHAILPLDAVGRLRDQLSAHLNAADCDAAGQEDDDGPMGYVLTGDCPHPVPGGPAFHIGPCRKCERAQRRQRRKDVPVPASEHGPGGRAQ